MGFFDKFKKPKKQEEMLTADDIYLGSELLKAWGADSNFSLIAINTTKYYLELTSNYGNRFSNEVSLLATAGLLDAQNYVFVERTINPKDIFAMAQKSALLGEQALLDFIIHLEIELFKIDTPGMDVSDIEMACFEKRENIAWSIQDTQRKYVSEPLFASTVSGFMDSSQFKSIRQMLGVKD
ncbi:MAG: hypothetical protein HQ588_04240 [Deltaproteobacteria bacterium]|nr:hypothetical protein [Deltaproteobacteria bacterium]